MSFDRRAASIAAWRHALWVGLLVAVALLAPFDLAVRALGAHVTPLAHRLLGVLCLVAVGAALAVHDYLRFTGLDRRLRSRFSR